MLGLFSYLDVLLDRPFEELLEKIPVTEEVKMTLLRKEETPFSILFDFCLHYERGAWSEIEESLKRMTEKGVDVLGIYLDALSFADAVFQAKKVDP